MRMVKSSSDSAQERTGACARLCASPVLIYMDLKKAGAHMRINLLKMAAPPPHLPLPSPARVFPHIFPTSAPYLIMDIGWDGRQG